MPAPDLALPDTSGACLSAKQRQYQCAPTDGDRSHDEEEHCRQCTKGNPIELCHGSLQSTSRASGPNRGHERLAPRVLCLMTNRSVMPGDRQDRAVGTQ
jgi:hypothetical protein